MLGDADPKPIRRRLDKVRAKAASWLPGARLAASSQRKQIDVKISKS